MSRLRITYSYKDGKQTVDKAFWGACRDDFDGSGGIASPLNGGKVTMKVEAPQDVAARLVVLLAPASS